MSGQLPNLVLLVLGCYADVNRCMCNQKGSATRHVKVKALNMQFEMWAIDSRLTLKHEHSRTGRNAV